MALVFFGLQPGDAGRRLTAMRGLWPVPGSMDPRLALVRHVPPRSRPPVAHRWNVACLAFAGFIVERAIGHLAFLVLYLTAGICGWAPARPRRPDSLEPMVSASGAICGVLAVLGALRPRLLGFVVGFTLVNVCTPSSVGGEGVSFGTHLGGFAVGVLAVAAVRATGNELEAA